MEIPLPHPGARPQVEQTNSFALLRGNNPSRPVQNGELIAPKQHEARVLGKILDKLKAFV